jgi:imidazolonepropionase-like amidohydrolase
MKRLLIVLLFASTAHAQTTYIKAARMFDGRSERVVPNAVIVVEGSKIKAIGAGIAIPAGANVIDLGDRTALPGLIDAHTHIVLHQGNYEEQVLRESPEFRAITATVMARTTLEAGFTTIRDLGNEGAGVADLAVRDAIAQGWVPGPRILASIEPLVTTGAYRIGRLSPNTTPPSIATEANGPFPLRAAVRDLVTRGADLIKVYLDSGRKRTSSDLRAAPTYSQPEVNAIVEEAHAAGLKVAGHALTDAAAKMGVIAGVDSIEHGIDVSEETFRAMAEKGIYWVPTLVVYEMWAEDPELIGEGATPTKARLEKTVAQHSESFKRALKTPVKIALGTDTFAKPGTNAQELASMVRLGMTPLDALRSATSGAATLLGVDGITGTLEPGKSADIIAVAGNPLNDVMTLQHVSFVMKDGKVYLGLRP